MWIKKTSIVVIVHYSIDNSIISENVVVTWTQPQNFHFPPVWLPATRWVLRSNSSTLATWWTLDMEPRFSLLSLLLKLWVSDQVSYLLRTLELSEDVLVNDSLWWFKKLVGLPILVSHPLVLTDWLMVSYTVDMFGIKEKFVRLCSGAKRV